MTPKIRPSAPLGAAALCTLALSTACAGDDEGGSFTASDTATSTATATATSTSTSTSTGTTVDTSDTATTTAAETTTSTTVDTSSSTTTPNPDPMCGNGVVEGDEECDDGPANADTALCTSACTAARCGDSLVGPGEECDDGDDDDLDACLSGCVAATCGDGFIHDGAEQCDDGNDDDGDACVAECKLATCGDGFIGPGEACDDGNTDNGDECTSACALASCGDGAPQMGEECDDGNMIETDACLNSCLAAKCGDGVTQAGVEECDDGNNSNADACLVSCKLATCSDTLKSGAETDVDCGGPMCGKCKNGKTCAADSDCTSGACVDGACNLPVSCKQLKNGLPNTPNGVYQIDTDGDGPKIPFEVYCEMVVDGGGWTLVGRSRNTPQSPGCSATDGGQNFGWRQTQGSVNDDAQAYSLDVGTKGIAFTQVLFGDHAGSKAFASAAYRQPVVAGFLDTYTVTHYFIGKPTTILGGCNDSSMFNWMGFTNNTDNFHMRDVDGNGFGLTASGFRSCYDTCVGGDLNGKPGMIYVR